MANKKASIKEVTKFYQELDLQRSEDKEKASLDECRARIEDVYDTIKYFLSNGYDFPIEGLGIIKQKRTNDRNGRNPQSGEPMLIKAKNTLKFDIADAYEKSLNQN